jgi:hypothetical protein
MNTIEKIIAYENGEMEDPQETVQFFQEIINSGLIWQLQGHYQRTAKSLIEAVLCTTSENN